jgi:hypothetical protein
VILGPPLTNSLRCPQPPRFACPSLAFAPPIRLLIPPCPPPASPTSPGPPARCRVSSLEPCPQFGGRHGPAVPVQRLFHRAHPFRQRFRPRGLQVFDFRRTRFGFGRGLAKFQPFALRAARFPITVKRGNVCGKVYRTPTGSAFGPRVPSCLPAQNQLRVIDRQHRAPRISGSVIEPGMLPPPSSQNLRLPRIGLLPHHDAKLDKPAS